MDRVWRPEIAVETALAAALIEEQFPDLAPVTIQALRPGWDNTVFRVNGKFVFRFPRREIAVPLIETELRALPIISTLVPVPVPVPVFSGRPSAAYPWPFAGFMFLSGTRAAGALGSAWRERLVPRLAGFLKALHAIPIGEFPAGALPTDRFERLNPLKHVVRTESRLDHLVATGAIPAARPILDILERAPQTLPAAGLSPVHGDLHGGQLLLGDEGELTGVIDWGDAHLGDPAVDLAALFQLLPKRLHDEFFEVYGAVDEMRLQLARARAAWHAVATLVAALDEGDTDLAAEARSALVFILE